MTHPRDARPRSSDMSPDLVSRRALLALGLATFAAPALAAPPRAGRLAFAVFRNGVEVGRHRMTFQGPADAPRVLTEVEMLVKLGPVPVFRYRHTADERWADGRFASLETRTDANGKVRRVAARRTPGGVVIEAGKSRIVAPAAAAPMGSAVSDFSASSSSRSISRSLPSRRSAASEAVVCPPLTIWKSLIEDRSFVPLGFPDRQWRADHCVHSSRGISLSRGHQ